MRNGSINFLERNERLPSGRKEGGREEQVKTKGRKADVRRAWIESIVANREKYALIRAGACNLWICGEPDAYRQWPTSRDSYNHRLLRCYSSTVNQVRSTSFLLPLLGPLMLCSFPYLGAINRTTDRSTLIFSSRRPILSILIFFQI